MLLEALQVKMNEVSEKPRCLVGYDRERIVSDWRFAEKAPPITSHPIQSVLLEDACPLVQQILTTEDHLQQW